MCNIFLILMQETWLTEMSAGLGISKDEKDDDDDDANKTEIKNDDDDEDEEKVATQPKAKTKKQRRKAKELKIEVSYSFNFLLSSKAVVLNQGPYGLWESPYKILWGPHMKIVNWESMIVL